MLKLGPLRQLGYVVPSAADAALTWNRRYGAGPFYLLEQVQFPGWTFRGEAQQLPLDIAFGQLGDVMLEFITPHSGLESVYSDSQSFGHGLRPSMSGKGNCYDNASVGQLYTLLSRPIPV